MKLNYSVRLLGLVKKALKRKYSMRDNANVYLVQIRRKTGQNIVRHRLTETCIDLENTNRPQVSLEYLLLH